MNQKFYKLRKIYDIKKNDNHSNDMIIKDVCGWHYNHTIENWKIGC